MNKYIENEAKKNFRRLRLALFFKWNVETYIPYYDVSFGQPGLPYMRWFLTKNNRNKTINTENIYTDTIINKILN